MNCETQNVMFYVRGYSYILEMGKYKYKLLFSSPTTKIRIIKELKILIKRKRKIRDSILFSAKQNHAR